MNRLIRFILLFQIFSVGAANAQSVKNIEDKIVYYLRELKDDKKSADANEQLLAFLKSSGTQKPAMLTTPFKRAEAEGMHIIASNDKKVKVYCWDDQQGGSMRGFHSLMQYQTPKGAAIIELDKSISTEEGADPGYYYSDIKTIPSKIGQTYYLVIGSGIYSTKDLSMRVKAYAIKNGMINDSIRIFKTKHSYLNEISYSYNYFSNYSDKEGKENNEIHFSGDNQILYIPIVVKDSVTNKCLVYKFDGEYFVFDKGAK